MAGTIEHSWNGTILTIKSDSGTSSMDLKGSVGDMGPRGPQGPCGILYDSEGKVASEIFATKEEIPDVSGFQTAAQVQAAINEALNAIGVAEEGVY